MKKNESAVAHKCDWCGKPAKVYVEKVKTKRGHKSLPTGIKWFSCGDKECNRKTEGIFLEKKRTGLRPVV